MSARGAALRGREVVEARASLRLLVEAIDAGEVEADGAQRAYLVGALDTLDLLVEPTRTPD